MTAFKRVAFVVIALVITVLCEDNLFCDTLSKSCEDSFVKDKKLLFYDVNPQEGFNLKRDVYMRFAIATARENKKRKSKWNLVLPPWYRLYHWRSQDYWTSKPVPWGLFFDLDAFRTFVPVLDIVDAFKYTNENNVALDRIYVLKNFPDAFEGGRFVEKWKIIKEQCEYNGNHCGYENITAKEIICVQFQGKASKLFELISLHPGDNKVMFANGEIALHDTYGSKVYWDCRKSMKFNETLLDTAQNFIKINFECDEKCDYLSVHWRRRDFARTRSNDIPSIAGTAKQINEFAKMFNLSKIFIATDASNSELATLKTDVVIYNNYKVFKYRPSDKQLNAFKDGGVAIVEQIICSRAAFFIGTHESTFTFRIQEEREILGLESDTTFNRLCPDNGACEKMSKWTIVN